MGIALTVVLLLLNFINVFFHTAGCYLLICIKKREDENRIQLLFLIHLSICEALMNLFEGIRRIPEFFALNTREKKLNATIQNYIMIVMFAGISVVYYLDMMYLTINRLLDILLNIRYHLYISYKLSKRLILITWLFAGSLAILIGCLSKFTAYNWEEQIFVFCFPILNFIFIIISLVTYGLIFLKYRRTRKSPSCNGQPRQSVYQTFRNSRFYVPVLLILTFLVFIVVPDLTYLFVAVVKGNDSTTLLVACWISYAIGNLSDCYIYIFMQRSVRRLLLKKLMKIWGRTNFGPFGKRPPHQIQAFTMRSHVNRGYSGDT